MNESVPLGIMERSVPSGTQICTFLRGPTGRDGVEPSEYLGGTGLSDGGQPAWW
jgi:hypothetical protein